MERSSKSQVFLVLWLFVKGNLCQDTFLKFIIDFAQKENLKTVLILGKANEFDFIEVMGAQSNLLQPILSFNFCPEEREEDLEAWEMIVCLNPCDIKLNRVQTYLLPEETTINKSELKCPSWDVNQGSVALGLPPIAMDSVVPKQNITMKQDTVLGFITQKHSHPDPAMMMMMKMMI